MQMPAYKKVKEIKSGGQAAVWRGRDMDTGQYVALKYLTVRGEKRPKSAEAEEERIRFIREVKTQQELSHPNITPVLAYSGKVHHPWYAMPLADETFEDCLKGPKRDVSWSLEVIHQVIDAMEYSHEQGVIHRDLKPSNILSINNSWLVSDFGYCRNLNSESIKMTQAKALLGTWFYAAPEQFDDAHEAGPPADVYAVGKILMYCLTGNPPGPYLRLKGVSEPYKDVIVRCAAEEPEDRYQSMSALREALLSIAPRN
ncbi:serine/threonine-protein kinase [Streptomyces pseudovenezuelae]|uniref:serine/threonine-protein kinase n=1 Tax=Streptomyces pseudovenezuelae TaxID=67350 RepID=UPI002E318907|nr:serine/threonine-protein kinase [Streptomyces pseudovenezuelae]